MGDVNGRCELKGAKLSRMWDKEWNEAVLEQRVQYTESHLIRYVLIVAKWRISSVDRNRHKI